MNIKRAKEEIEHTVKAYLAKDALGEYAIPAIRQRPILLMGPPGIGKTQVMEQVARECGVALVAYTITHHTRQSAVGLPFIRQRNYGGKDVSVTEYTMSEIIASIYAKIEATGLSEGILFIDEINCVSVSYMTFIWEQLADRFGDYDEHVIFESINEPRLVETDHEWWLDMNAAECVEAVECINEWNQNFVDVVRKTGGNNATRYLMVPGYDASADGVLNDKFVLPTDTAENEGKILVSVHAYIPYHFALQAATENESIDQFNASEKTSTNDIDQMMEKLYAKYISNEIPVVIGEFGARDKNGNLQSRVDYAAYYIAAARAYGMSCNWWDNNAFTGDGELFGLLDRKTVTWRYPKIVDALMKYAE